MALLKERNLLNYTIAFEAIVQNKFRSLLTALGIIFGVAAVIAMLAIGNGARQEILDQIKLVGLNNIVIKPITDNKKDDTADDKQSKEDKKKFSPGLTLKDAESIKAEVPSVSRISPEIVLETHFVRNGLNKAGKLVGVLPDYFVITDFKLESGSMFSSNQLIKGEQVCILGSNAKAKYFSSENALGQYIKCGTNWLKVIGVLKSKTISEDNTKNLGIRNYNLDIYTPLKTILIRYKNRSLVTKQSITTGGDEGDDSKKDEESKNQLDRLVVQVANTDQLLSSSELINRMLQRRHNAVEDYEISVPELLLKSQQRTKDIFNIVLGVIAGISLVVGGIGIMNIMLATVLERLKEIGIRLSMGATKSDIVQQFLFEAVLISVSGGLVGIVLGVILSLLIAKVAGILTIISLWSILLSFGVAALTGLVFGIAPAKRAAALDPIQSLRHE